MRGATRGQKPLRTRVAEVIADAKAYDVPALCEQLGLGTGDEDEAMRNKFKYAYSRLMGISGGKLLAVARSVLAEEQDFFLGEIVAKIEEHATPAASALTRRRILATFDGTPLCTEYDEIEFLEQIWPLGAMPSVFDTNWGAERSLREDILQHTIRNDDWTNRKLLDHLGLVSCSQSLFFRFLDAVVHPTAASDDVQRNRVEQINEHLRHDGYQLQRTVRCLGVSSTLSRQPR